MLNLKPIRISLFARSFVAVVGDGDGDGAVECWLPVCRLDGLPGCRAAGLPAPATLAATAMATTVTQTATGGRSQLNNASHNNSNSNNNSHNDSEPSPLPPLPIIRKATPQRRNARVHPWRRIGKEPFQQPRCTVG